MDVLGTIQTDQELHNLLSVLEMFPANTSVPTRMFCKITKEAYNSKIPADLGDGRKNMNSVYKNYAEDEDGVYILLGEDAGTANDDGTPSGGRNYTTNPTSKEEVLLWIDQYGIESMHLDFPRVDVEI